MDFEFCFGWPQDLKDAEWRRYRAECRVRNLEGALDCTPPEEFDGLMSQIEAARKELIVAGQEVLQARIQWAQGDYFRQKGEAAEQNDVERNEHGAEQKRVL